MTPGQHLERRQMRRLPNQTSPQTLHRHMFKEQYCCSAIKYILLKTRSLNWTKGCECEKHYVRARCARVLDKCFPKVSFRRAQFQKTCSQRMQGSQERMMPQQSTREHVARFPKMFASPRGVTKCKTKCKTICNNTWHETVHIFLILLVGMVFGLICLSKVHSFSTSVAAAVSMLDPAVSYWRLMISLVWLRYLWQLLCTFVSLSDRLSHPVYQGLTGSLRFIVWVSSTDSLGHGLHNLYSPATETCNDLGNAAFEVKIFAESVPSLWFQISLFCCQIANEWLCAPVPDVLMLRSYSSVLLIPLAYFTTTIHRGDTDSTFSNSIRPRCLDLRQSRLFPLCLNSMQSAWECLRLFCPEQLPSSCSSAWLWLISLIWSCHTHALSEVTSFARLDIFWRQPGKRAAHFDVDRNQHLYETWRIQLWHAMTVCDSNCIAVPQSHRAICLSLAINFVKHVEQRRVFLQRNK